MIIVACTRFNNQTWQEYQDWKEQNRETYEKAYGRQMKCIYGSPREISHKKIPPQAKILVIEMNNEENRIMGIGQIENKTASEVYRRQPQQPPQNPSQGDGTPIKYANLFKDRNYSRYIYIGNECYMSREEIDRRIENDTVLPQLEQLLFKGARHSKRGSGITNIPQWVLSKISSNTTTTNTTTNTTTTTTTTTTNITGADILKNIIIGQT